MQACVETCHWSSCVCMCVNPHVYECETHPERGPWRGGWPAVAVAPGGPSAPPGPPPSTEPVCTSPAGRSRTQTAEPGRPTAGPRVRRARCRQTTHSGLREKQKHDYCDFNVQKITCFSCFVDTFLITNMCIVFPVAPSQ